MRRFLTALLLLFNSLLFSQIKPGPWGELRPYTLHAFLFCNTNDENLLVDTSCYYDYLNVERAVIKMADASHLTLDLHSYIDNNFNFKNIDSLARYKATGFYDIFLIYFSSHGERIKNDTSRFPGIIVPGQDSVLNAFELNRKILEKLMPQERLVITILDACNTGTGTSMVHSLNAKSMLNNKAKRVIRRSFNFDIGVDPNIYTASQCNNYTKLIRNLSSNIVITSSIPSQASKATKNGSLFTNALIKEIESKVAGGFVTDQPWHEILTAVKKSLPPDTTPTWIEVPEWYRSYAGFKLDYERRILHLCVKENIDSANGHMYVIAEPTFIPPDRSPDSPQEWNKLLFNYYGKVKYVVYDRIEGGYTNHPRIFWSTNRGDHFRITFSAYDDYRIEAVLMKDAERHIINIMDHCDLSDEQRFE